MADQDKDRTNQGSLAGGTQAGLGTGMQGGAPISAGGTSTPGSSGISSSSAAGSSGSMDTDIAGRSMTGSSSTTASSIKAGSARLANEARQYAGDIANRAKEKSRTVFDQQKESALGQVHSVADAFRNTAGNLQSEGQDQVARYIGMVADQLESLGGRLREKDLDTLISDTQNMVRRSPGTFFAGSVVAGFLLARFLKSSSEQRTHALELSREDLREDLYTPAEAGAGDYASMGGGFATPGAETRGVSTATGAGGTTELGADGTPSTAQGTSTTGPSTSPVTGSNPGGTSYGNR